MKRKPAPTPDPLAGVCTVAEAAILLGLTVQRVRQLCQAGDLNARQQQSSWMISRASVEGFVPKPVGRPRKVKG